MNARPLTAFVRVGQVITRKTREEMPVVKVRVQKMQFDPRLLMVRKVGGEVYVVGIFSTCLQRVSRAVFIDLKEAPGSFQHLLNLFTFFNTYVPV